MKLYLSGFMSVPPYPYSYLFLLNLISLEVNTAAVIICKINSLFLIYVSVLSEIKNY